jgi:hypothetical protein
MRQALSRDWHVTESKTMRGFFISGILRVFSSRILVTRLRAR